MKKTKLLMPILGVGAVAATVAPMVAITGCNKEEAEEFTIIDGKNITTTDVKNVSLRIKYNKYKKGMTFTAEIKGTFKDKDGKDYSIAGGAIFEKDTAETVLTFDKDLLEDNPVSGSIVLTPKDPKAEFQFKAEISGITITFKAKK